MMLEEAFDMLPSVKQVISGVRAVPTVHFPLFAPYIQLFGVGMFTV